MWVIISDRTLILYSVMYLNIIIVFNEVHTCVQLAVMQKQNAQIRMDLERESANRHTLQATMEQKDDLIRTLRTQGQSIRVCTIMLQYCFICVTDLQPFALYSRTCVM